MSHNGIVRFFGYVQIDVAVGNSIIRVMTSPSMRLPDAGRGQRSRQRDRSGECYIEAAQHTNKQNKVTLSTSRAQQRLVPYIKIGEKQESLKVLVRAYDIN